MFRYFLAYAYVAMMLTSCCPKADRSAQCSATVLPPRILSFCMVGLLCLNHLMFDKTL